MTLLDVLARLEWVLEALGDGDVAIAVDVLLDLRDDLLGATTDARVRIRGTQERAA